MKRNHCNGPKHYQGVEALRHGGKVPHDIYYHMKDCVDIFNFLWEILNLIFSCCVCVCVCACVYVCVFVCVGLCVCLCVCLCVF